MALVEDVVQKEIAESVSFIQQQMKVSSPSEIMGLNIYEFCRLFTEARKAQAQEAERMKKQAKKWQT